MDRDIYYNIIEADPAIQQVGKHIYDAKKPSKHKYAKIKALTAMRRLAKLVHLTKGVDEASELFVVGNFY